jgi:hypothetical protein
MVLQRRAVKMNAVRMLLARREDLKCILDLDRTYSNTGDLPSLPPASPCQFECVSVRGGASEMLMLTLTARGGPGEGVKVRCPAECGLQSSAPCCSALHVCN